MPLFAILLSSCGIPRLQQAQPGRELPGSFNGLDSSENSSQIGIEEFFDDPVLTGLIDQALGGNLELKILAQDIEIANNEILKRRGAYLPFVTLGAAAGVAKPSFFTPAGATEDQLTAINGQPFPQPLPNFLVAGDLTWQIDIWRQLRNSRDAASLQFLGTIEGRNYAITRLIAEIAENYYNLKALDKRLENLDRVIALQQQSLEIAQAQKAGARGTELGVQRFIAEVAKNQSEKLIVSQQIIVSENRINFLVGRYPERVERSAEFFDLSLHPLSLGVPADLLQNRPDIRQAERDLAAAGLDIKVARANFFPKPIISAGVGWEAFNTNYLFVTPESLIYNVAGSLVGPLINRKAIQAEYKNASAKQLQAIYNYQRTVLNAFTEVINRINMVQNYTNSIELKQKQLEALEASVNVATKLFQAARVEYIDVLFAQRDLMDARMVLIETKKEQLTAIVDTYQALGGGLVRTPFLEVTGAPPEANMPPPGAPPENKPPVVPPAPDKGDEVK